MIAHHLFGIKIGFTVILLNLPIYIFAWFHFRAYFYNSLHGLLVSAFILDLLASMHHNLWYYDLFSPLECSILGGIFIGSGVGLMLRNRISSEGTELIAQLISHKWRVNEGVVLFLFDLFPICLAEALIPTSHFFLSLFTIVSIGITTSLYTFKFQLN